MEATVFGTALAAFVLGFVFAAVMLSQILIRNDKKAVKRGIWYCDGDLYRLIKIED